LLEQIRNSEKKVTLKCQPFTDFLPWTSNMAILSCCVKERISDKCVTKGKCMGRVWSVYKNHCAHYICKIVLSSLQSSLCSWSPVACVTDRILNACHEVSNLVSLGLLTLNRSIAWPRAPPRRHRHPTSITGHSWYRRQHFYWAKLHKCTYIIRSLSPLITHQLLVDLFALQAIFFLWLFSIPLKLWEASVIWKDDSHVICIQKPS